MKKHKLLLQTIIATIILFVVHLLSNWILYLNDLAYRQWVQIVICILFALMVLAIIVQVIFILYKIAKNSMQKLWLRIIGGLGIVFITLATFYVSYWGLFLGAFAYRQEYVGDINNEKMVAYVNVWLHVDVEYYAYENAILRGNHVRLSANYDDIKPVVWPSVFFEISKAKQYTFYDEKGNVIYTNR